MAFKAMDLNLDSVIDDAELMYFMRNTIEAEEMMVEADTNCNGHISYDEFRAVMLADKDNNNHNTH
eukprot:361880-Chlamydomonas_euryale.AAC.4